VVEAALAGPADDLPDALLLTGDLAQDGSPEAYARLAGHLLPHGLPAWCIPGNHDAPTVLRATLSGPLFRHERHADFGPWRLVFLNTHDGDRGGGRLSRDELAGGARSLAEPGPEHILVVMHHHPIPIDSWLDQSAALDNQDALWALIGEEPRVRAVLFGHVHQAVDRLHGNVRILGTPSTCFQFAPGVETARLDARPPGWRWLDLHDSGDMDTGLVWLAEQAGGGPS
jgi:Icc protein